MEIPLPSFILPFSFLQFSCPLPQLFLSIFCLLKSSVLNPSSSLTAPHLHMPPPHVGLPAPTSTRWLIFSFSRSHGDPLSLFNFSIVSSLFFIFQVCLILNQCYFFSIFMCKNPCAWLFIFSISSLFFIFQVCYFFLCLLSQKINDKELKLTEKPTETETN